ncbi:sigma-70 family RNA polymerase sigma factor [Eubacteriales bacterium OttesenSCG-928-G02]|nr:sigma-70 family RNA polymerase sigma factor [Eubacteriales bacterium OttesenSCG-928-G02]
MSMTNEEIVLKIQEGDKSLHTLLWDKVYKLLYMRANGFYRANSELCARAGVDDNDLKQECYTALLEAVDDYKPEKEYLFNTYLKLHCLNVFRAACGIRTVKKLPLNAYKSLDENIGTGENEYTLADTISDPDSEIPFNQTLDDDEYQIMKIDVQRAIDTLPKIQQDVLRGVYFQNKTYLQLGKELNKSGSYIGQMHNKALRTLRSCKRDEYRLLRKYVDMNNIISRYAYKGGFTRWKNTRTSSTEYAAMKLVDYQKNKSL